MLILTRGPKQTICIGNAPDGSPQIVIKVIHVRGNKVRIAVGAPRDVKVERQEAHLKRLAEQQ